MDEWDRKKTGLRGICMPKREANLIQFLMHPQAP